MGTFKTAPVPSKEESVNFVVGGDLGGQRYCKRVDPDLVGTYWKGSLTSKESSDDSYLSNFQEN